MSACTRTRSGNCDCGKARGDAGRCHRRTRGAGAFARVPGLFRGWEVEDLLASGDEIHVEPGGAMDDGTPLHVVFRREGARP